MDDRGEQGLGGEASAQDGKGGMLRSAKRAGGVSMNYLLIQEVSDMKIGVPRLLIFFLLLRYCTIWRYQAVGQSR